ncbi:hypothetical protein JCGZ_18089 [Jatropha curcas]|uniref:Uncharacterized protein n=1 Tax=Jatropha curcas TaxID=180498 RepID=A0A067K2G0_JATCU|nr:hypothetical protein JCGZ_18089 [Jatropha curcas]
MIPRVVRREDHFVSWGLARDSQAGRWTAAATTVYGGRKTMAARHRVLFTPSGSVFTQESVFGISCSSLVP